MSGHSGVTKITDSKGCIKIKFIRPVMKLSQKEVTAQCMQDVEGLTTKQYNPLLRDMVLQDAKNFYTPGEVYDVPLEKAQLFIRMGIPIKHIDNSNAASSSEVVTKTDQSDPRLRSRYEVAELVDKGLDIKEGEKKTAKKVIKNSPNTDSIRANSNPMPIS